MSDLPSPAPTAVLQYSTPGDSPTPPRLVAVLVPAIVGVVVGATSLLASAPLAVSYFMLMSGRWRRGSPNWFQLATRNPRWLAPLAVLYALAFVLDVWLVIASIGCLRRRRWARVAMLAWAAAALASAVLSCVPQIGAIAGFRQSREQLLFVGLDKAGQIILPLWILIRFMCRREKKWFDHSSAQSPAPSDPRQRRLAAVGMAGIVWSSFCLTPQWGDAAFTIAFQGLVVTTRELWCAILALASTALLFIASVASVKLLRWGRWALAGWALGMMGWTVAAMLAGRYGTVYCIACWPTLYQSYSYCWMIIRTTYQQILGLPVTIWNPFPGVFVLASVGIALGLGYAIVAAALLLPTRDR